MVDLLSRFERLLALEPIVGVVPRRSGGLDWLTFLGVKPLSGPHGTHSHQPGQQKTRRLNTTIIDR